MNSDEFTEAEGQSVVENAKRAYANQRLELAEQGVQQLLTSLADLDAEIIKREAKKAEIEAVIADVEKGDAAAIERMITSAMNLNNFR